MCLNKKKPSELEWKIIQKSEYEGIMKKGERSETEDQMEVNFLLYLLDSEGCLFKI